MSTEPTIVTAPPEASPEVKALNAAIDAEDGANTDKPADTAVEAEKKEPTPEQRERRLQRKIDRLLQQRGELRERLGGQQLTRETIARDNTEQSSDNETLSLSRKELDALIEKEAKKLAPQIGRQQTEIERQRAFVGRLAKELGQEKFDALSSDLDDAFGGLTDDNQRPKPAVDAIFESDMPAVLIEYLADPDHADEAEDIGRMSAVQAGRAITKLEAKLAEMKAKDKPQPSKVAAPIEPVRGQGNAPKSLADLSDSEFAKRRRQQIANRR